MVTLIFPKRKVLTCSSVFGISCNPASRKDKRSDKKPPQTQRRALADLSLVFNIMGASTSYPTYPTDLATITAVSENGLTDAFFYDVMPEVLAKEGVSAHKWMKIIRRANDAVCFSWGPGSILCFLCNAHNKKIRKPMKRFCNEINVDGSLPPHIKARYEMWTELQDAVNGGVSGSGTLATFHKVVFYSST